MAGIFLIGLASTQLGAMETGGNLGNYSIIYPLLKRLRSEFPGFRITTSIQLSDPLCRRFAISCKREKRFWTYGKETALATAGDIVRVLIYWLLKQIIGEKAAFAIGNSEFLTEVYKADLVIDLSGDIFGENAAFSMFLEECAELMFAKLIGKPVVMLAGSPGPFNSWWRKYLARFVLNRLSLITNREPISTEILIRLGVRKPPIKTTACPAFLFEGKPREQVEGILRKEHIYPDRGHPVIGVIITGWNMPKPPFHRIPREKEELQPFLPMIRFLLEEVKAQVVLMSHSHRLDTKGCSIPGPDATIMSQIYNMLNPSRYGDKLILLRGLYDAATMKGIIGCFDMLVSGRLHGAISGLSQMIPTAFVDYGHEPKAHKLRGVAQLLDLESCICDPKSHKQMVKTVSLIWENRSTIRHQLHGKIAMIRQQCLMNFKLLHDFPADWSAKTESPQRMKEANLAQGNSKNRYCQRGSGTHTRRNLR